MAEANSVDKDYLKEINVNRSGKPTSEEYRRALRMKLGSTVGWVDYSKKGVDVDLLPHFQYLDWNIDVTAISTMASVLANQLFQDRKSEIVDGVKSAIQSMEEEVNAEIQNKVLPAVREHVREILDIRASLKTPDFRASIENVMVKKDGGQGHVEMDNQGDGVKRHIWYALLKMNAERLGKRDVCEGSVSKSYIWAFDEPETHLYPPSQRSFFETLKKLAIGEVQVVLSTHSTIFVDRADLNSIRCISLLKSFTTTEDAHSGSDVLSFLGVRNSDFLFFNKFLIVEGPTEMILIPHLYSLYAKRSLSDDGIGLISLGGSGNRKASIASLEQAFEGYGGGFRKLSVYIFDQDEVGPNLNQATHENIFFIGRQAIEDSILSSVWVKVVNKWLLENNIDASIPVDWFDAQLAEIPAHVIGASKYPESDKLYGRLKRKITEVQDELHRASGGVCDEDYYKSRPRFPDKGAFWGRMLADEIDSLDQVSSNFATAFTSLQRDIG